MSKSNGSDEEMGLEESNGKDAAETEPKDVVEVEVEETAEDVPQDGAEATKAELQDLGREIRERAEEVRKEVVKQLFGVAETIRDEARDNEAEGEMLDTADKIAEGLEKAGNYLDSRTVDTLGEEATRVVRRSPWRVIMTVFAIGIGLGIFFRRD